MKIVYCAERYNDYIILQTPLPPTIDVEELKKCIDPQKDIDNISGKSNHFHNTPLGIIKYLDACNFDYCGADAVIIGRSDVVGKPMAKMLLDKNCTVTICHSKTEYLAHYTEWADLVVVAVGKPEWFDPELAKSAKIIIDVGINFKDGKIVGDVQSQYGSEANRITPVPGGVGLLTRCALLEQIIK
ncbi:MAG: bifunctional 5,10-methylenetetrahydrofolate dehydrogenase/5,10-methenyltetrahydrofolate cyclohydrolase [Firmicutes bacterium]|nr:bifunctional 5,10-methylenetetrahydrofolate dehydrogenase/5,10-methenyltetrahydrofolate cyclohydrolase [Bacillota bacterium]